MERADLAEWTVQIYQRVGGGRRSRLRQSDPHDRRYRTIRSLLPLNSIRLPHPPRHPFHDRHRIEVPGPVRSNMSPAT
jgi:hypothetical protein